MFRFTSTPRYWLVLFLVLVGGADSGLAQNHVFSGSYSSNETVPVITMKQRYRDVSLGSLIYVRPNWLIPSDEPALQLFQRVKYYNKTGGEWQEENGPDWSKDWITHAEDYKLFLMAGTASASFIWTEEHGRRDHLGNGESHYRQTRTVAERIPLKLTPVMGKVSRSGGSLTTENNWGQVKQPLSNNSTYESTSTSLKEFVDGHQYGEAEVTYRHKYRHRNDDIWNTNSEEQDYLAKTIGPSLLEYNGDGNSRTVHSSGAGNSYIPYNIPPTSPKHPGFAQTYFINVEPEAVFSRPVSSALLMKRALMSLPEFRDAVDGGSESMGNPSDSVIGAVSGLRPIFGMRYSGEAQYSSAFSSLSGTGSLFVSESDYWFESNDCLPHIFTWFEVFQPDDDPTTLAIEGSELEYTFFSYTAGENRSSKARVISPARQGRLGRTTVETLPIEMVSRDKYFAGSIKVPYALSDVELEFVNTSTGENLGRYGRLNGDGDTRVFHGVYDIFTASAEHQPDQQKVWFCHNYVDDKIDFYTCFNQVGQVQIKVYMGKSASPLGSVKHTLKGDNDMAEWIAYTDAWVKGDSFTYFISGQQNRMMMMSAADEGINNYTRACMIPIFGVIAQVEGAQIAVLGMLEGARMGLHDDAEMLSAVKSGLINAGTWVVHQAATQARLAGLKTSAVSDLNRAIEFHHLVHTFVHEVIIPTVHEDISDLGTWSGLQRAGWAALKRYSGTAQLYAIGKEYGPKLAASLESWFDDFNNRMQIGAEKAAFFNVPWGTDTLLADLIGYGRQAAYTAGYIFGYCCEQIAMGAAQDVIAKIGVKAARGGAILAGQLVEKTRFAVATRMHLVKKRMAGVAVNVELLGAIERGIAKETRTAVSETIRESGGEVVERNLSRGTFPRDLAALDDFVTAAWQNARTALWYVKQNDEFFRCSAKLFETLGETLTPKAVKGWLKYIELNLPLNPNDLNRIANFHKTLKTDTAAGKLCALKTLEDNAERSIDDILTNGYKVSKEIKDVYPTMYHYSDGPTLAGEHTIFENGKWTLKAKSNGRYIGVDNLSTQVDAISKFQLPKKVNADGVWLLEPSKGRFKCIIRTSDIADDITIPQSWVHSKDADVGSKQWLEVFTKENPHCGAGDAIQYTQRLPVEVQVIDLKTGVIVQDKMHLAELMAL